MSDPRPEDVVALQAWLAGAERDLADREAAAALHPGSAEDRRLLADDDDALADARDGLADARDRAAAQRDLTAAQRDLQADERDDSARISPRRPDPGSPARLLSAADRDDARGDRIQSLQERRSAALDRRRAAAHRERAAAARHAGIQTAVRPDEG